MPTKKLLTKSGIYMPVIIYGTAWKAEKTCQLVKTAILQGFRGIDTACQPKHYHEAGVGEGLKLAFLQGGISREDIFLQTKFTSLNGQDPQRVPYTKNAPLEQQVLQSIDASLKNLQTTYVDSLVLHGPLEKFSDTLAVWRQMEKALETGKVRQLGVSNFYDLNVLEELHRLAKYPPAVIQNRFYPETNFDHDIREFCNRENIIYQSFWTLSANRHVLASTPWKKIASAADCTPEQLMFAFTRALGIVPLTGTCSLHHMKEDLAIVEALENPERNFLVNNPRMFSECASLLGVAGASCCPNPFS